MSTETMTARERLLATMRGLDTDRVPVQVGMGQMVPARRTGLPFWDIYRQHRVELWREAIATQKHFGCDGYVYMHVGHGPIAGDRREFRQATARDDDEMQVVRTTCRLPGGRELWQETAYPKWDCPTTTRGWVKNEDDLALFTAHFLPITTDWNTTGIAAARALMGEDGLVGASVGLPGLHALSDLCDGKLATATALAYDHPDLVEAWRAASEAATLARLDRILDARPDYVEISASGMLTLSNPRLVRQLCLPTLREIARRCRQADIPSELHCCGKARQVVRMVCDETELCSINPLQPPPMGDCVLADIKREFGHRITLKGNVGVTFPMLMGTPHDVEQAVADCLRAGMPGGRYILFTEEQIGRDTPDANIHAFVAAGKALGRYAARAAVA